ncbi:hypothetical protein [Pseudoxanthomonas sp. PXM01]|uniref:hypothetical protein n=1 Tax=Pseudoxanthomonas sp. PXM01 TaxID=2769295 RepID=UPI00177BB22A|nr:hypothetical protein [Pseudoxanthomonas sp. PXM01]MBD9468784.1 hypothetical protein [Pseudoxanthomonas sp. PXM01]
MPDSLVRDEVPRDWRDAFGALPLEAPPEGSWQRLAATLPPAHASARRARWRRPALALAATAFFAAVIPLMHWRAVQTTPPPLQRAVPVTTIATPAPADAPVQTAIDAMPAAAAVREDAAPPTVARAPAAARSTARAVRDPAPARLDALYTESARLEAVLAHLPDSGTGNVAALAVSAELQDQVAHIDLALSQPALPDMARTALWEQRVDTLRQLTGVEATQRWQVALNDDADTAIY